MFALLSGLWGWLSQIDGIRQVCALPWHRLTELYVGEYLSLGALAAVTFLESAAAIDRFLAGDFSRPRTRKPGGGKAKKRRWGLKHLVLILVALLPGGLVGTFLIMAVMGKAFWRRDALKIFLISLVPGVLLGVLRLELFPWPQWRDAVYLSGTLGLIFATLQAWILVKLLRQWWGEPDEYIPWWPPLVLGMQALLLGACLRHILTP